MSPSLLRWNSKSNLSLDKLGQIPRSSDLRVVADCTLLLNADLRRR
jgi:hypothetical protein